MNLSLVELIPACVFIGLHTKTKQKKHTQLQLPVFSLELSRAHQLFSEVLYKQKALRISDCVFF